MTGKSFYGFAPSDPKPEHVARRLALRAQHKDNPRLLEIIETGVLDIPLRRPANIIAFRGRLDPDKWELSEAKRHAEELSEQGG